MKSLVRLILSSLTILWLTLLSCKPLDEGSDVAAIVGSENGKNKAFALIPVRNDVSMNNESSFMSNPAYRQAWKDMNEVFYALVECNDSKVSGQTFTAAQWMNKLEFMAMAGILYATPDRRIEYTLTEGGRTRNHAPPCVVTQSRLLTLPMLLSVPRGVWELPGKEPKKGSTEYKKARDTYKLMQTMYLALRGPYSPGAVSVAPKLLGFTTDEGRYPTIDFNKNKIAIALSTAAENYVPCHPSVPSGKPLDYLKDWRDDFYKCEPVQGISNLFNYKPTNKNGETYTKLKQGAANKIEQMFRGTYGSVSTSSSEKRKLLEVLTHPVSWKQISGPVAGLAKHLAGGAKPQGMQLTGGASFEDKTFFDAYGKEKKTLGLTNNAEAQAAQLAQWRSMMKRIGEAKSPYDLNSWLEMDHGTSAFNTQANAFTTNTMGQLINPGRPLYFYHKDRYTADEMQAYSLMQKAAADASKRYDAASGKDSRIDQLIGQSLASGQLGQNLLAYKQINAANASNAQYKRGNTYDKFQYYNNERGDTLIGSAGNMNDISGQIKSGDIKDMRMLYKGEKGTYWNQANAAAGIDLFPGTGVKRIAGWDAKGNGFQGVATQGSAFENALNFDYGFTRNEPGSPIGRFTMKDPSKAIGQLGTLKDEFNTKYGNQPAAQSGFLGGLNTMWNGWGQSSAASQAGSMVAGQQEFVGNSVPKLSTALDGAANFYSEQQSAGSNLMRDGANEAFQSSVNYAKENSASIIGNTASFMTNPIGTTAGWASSWMGGGSSGSSGSSSGSSGSSSSGSSGSAGSGSSSSGSSTPSGPPTGE